jgi:energy-coupling factor transporter ATP-binding protein EcfA2
MKSADPFGDAFEDALADTDLFGPGGACPVVHEPGNRRLFLITGENAGGKSFFSKVVASFVHEESPGAIEFINVSMGMRTAPGMHRVFMFGEESRDSTGKISLGAVLGSLRTCRSREKPHVLVLDEPDIGLSEGYRAGLGDLLAAFGAELPELTRALVVVTHSREVARRLMPLAPTCIRIGEDHRPTAEWIRDGDPVRTIEELEGLAMKATPRIRAILAVLNTRKAERQTSPAP